MVQSSGPMKQRRRDMAGGKRAAIYLRVSTTGQTVENQRRELEQIAERRGWTVAAVYEDAGISGAKGRDKQAGFDRVVKDPRPGKLRGVMGWAIDRLGRPPNCLSP